MQKEMTFKQHENMLLMVMKRQAGSVAKAIMEAVQNSIDAGASEIKIQFSTDSLSVTDNGKGFENSESIERFFNTFGEPHTKDDAVYGYYRVGRGQIFAFLPTVWRSNQFRMDVDIANRGTDWTFYDNQPMVDGCTFSGDFYNKIPEYEYMYQVNVLKSLVKYSSVPIYLNGALISIDPSSLEDWDYEDSNCYLKLGESDENLEVYNIGMFVRSYHGRQFGFSGIIVSKKRLEVNMARNDIQINECEIWKEISARAEEIISKSLVHKKAYTKIEREFLLGKLSIGEVKVSALYSKPILTDISGKSVSLSTLANSGDFAFFDAEHKSEGIFWLNSGILVMPNSILKSLGIVNGDDFLELLISSAENTNIKNAFSNLNNIPQGELLRMMNEKKISVRETDLSKKDQKTFKRIMELNETVFSMIIGENGYGGYTNLHHYFPSRSDLQLRRMIPNTMKSDLMNTDGDGIINVSTKLIKSCSNNQVSMKNVALIILHEYLHTAASSEYDRHDFEFYRDFHNMLIYSNFLSYI